MRFTKTALFTLSFLIASSSYAAVNISLSYSNTNFNSTQPGWANTLTVYNNSDQPVAITKLSFETNYDGLDTQQLTATPYSLVTLPKTTPEKLKDYDYRYTLQQTDGKSVIATIPAHGSIFLGQIPLAHEQTSKDGIPVFYRTPFNVAVTLENGTNINIPLQNACQNNACNDPGKGKIIGSYFTDWANYRYGNSENALYPSQIPLANMNTIYYAIFKINRDTADVGFVDINHDQYYLPAFDTLRQQYPYLNVLLSFGGWGDAAANNYPSYDLAAIFDKQDSALIQKLANNMVRTMLTLGLNGIDIDYEWNAIEPGSANGMQLTPARAKGYQQLLQALRQELDKIQPAENPHYYKVTSAVFAGADTIQLFINQGGDWQAVAKALDYFNVMTYDMHGQFDVSQPAPDNVTDFLSAMQTEYHYQGDALNHYNVIDAIEAYKNVGVPSEKIVLGIPAYTRIEKTATPVTDQNKGLYLTLASDQPNGEAPGGTVDYKCIVDKKYCWGGFSLNESTLTRVPAILSGEGLGSLAQTPWAYDKTLNWFMSFDDGVSAKNKAVWAKQQNLGGVMMWEIDGDIPQTDAAYEEKSIIYNAWLGLQ